MRHNFFYIGLVWFACSCTVSGQQEPKMIPVGPLPTGLVENSGLVLVGPDEYIGINDSGHDASLYFFGLNKPSGRRTIKVTDATNVDWEELTVDANYLYICDFGNNLGDRKDLTIYRVNLVDTRKGTEATCDTIRFTYDRQSSLKPNKKTNFDCEAMVSIGDSLYLFTKNHGNLQTDVYSLPNTPGNYKARHIGQYETEGMVTGAAYRNKYGRNELVLLGYKSKKNDYHPFILHFTDIPGNDFFKSPVYRYDFPMTSLQVESILFKDAITLYVSNEEQHGDAGLVYKIPVKTDQ